MPADQFGLVVKRIQMAAGSGAENHDDTFCSSRKMCRTSSERTIGLNLRTLGLSAADGAFFRLLSLQKSLLRKQGCQRNTAEPRGRVAEESTAIQQLSAVH